MMSESNDREMIAKLRTEVEKLSRELEAQRRFSHVLGMYGFDLMDTLGVVRSGAELLGRYAVDDAEGAEDLDLFNQVLERHATDAQGIYYVGCAAMGPQRLEPLSDLRGSRGLPQDRWTVELHPSVDRFGVHLSLLRYVFDVVARVVTDGEPEARLHLLVEPSPGDGPAAARFTVRAPIPVSNPSVHYYPPGEWEEHLSTRTRVSLPLLALGAFDVVEVRQPDQWLQFSLPWKEAPSPSDEPPSPA